MNDKRLIMKKTILFAVFIVLSISLFAQREGSDSLSIQSVINACVQLRDAVASGDPAAIQQSADQLRACNTSPFNRLTCSDTGVVSLNGHLIFDETFADSLAEGKDVYNKAEDINKTRTTRGMIGDSPKTVSRIIQAGKSSKFTFKAVGWQELAVVAEDGGKVTMKIHVTNSKGFELYRNDTEDVRPGRSERKTGFQLPNMPPCVVELEVVNCVNKDISIVVISN